MKIDKNITYKVDDFLFKNFVNLSESEIETVWRWRNNDSVRRFMYNTNTISFNEHLKFLNGLYNRIDSYYWIVYKKSTPIGVMNITSVNSTKNIAEIGFYQAPTICGQGFKLLYSCYKLFFNSLGFDSLYACVNTYNIESLLLSRYLGCIFDKKIDKNETTYLVSDNLTRDLFNSSEKSLKGFIDFLKLTNKMETKILEIINDIRAAKSMNVIETLNATDNLRNDLGLTSFDLAELTVRIEDEFDIDIFEDGLVNTVGEIYAKLQK